MRILLVNPPIYDFSAYDFWLRPYGMLRVAGRLRRAARLSLFDFLISENRDSHGRGRFPEEVIPKPHIFAGIPRHFRRFGRPRMTFRQYLKNERFDAALVQTGMTYWYPGVREVLEDLRELQPRALVILGGIYATLCPTHAKALGPDLVVEGSGLDPLWQLLGVRPSKGPPYWECLSRGQERSGPRVGVLKLTEGCPFRCTYCSVPAFSPEFTARPLGECLQELRHLRALGMRQVAFYDDALLHQPERIITPFLEAARADGLRADFHTPNGLNARFLSRDLARRLVQSGFQTFYLGLESSAGDWQKKTGGKVYPEELSGAIGHLRDAGAHSITTYVILGHPRTDGQQIENTLRFAAGEGTRIMLAEFAPIPGTPDGELARRWIDLDEPLNHNKTAFTCRLLGISRYNRLKALCRELNGEMS